MSSTLKGVEEMKRKLRGLAREFPLTVAKAAEQEFDIELAEMVRRTPKLTGALARSGKRHPAVVDAQGNVRVEITFGDNQVDYAIKVHEDLEAFHRNGQAKFMESVLNESRSSMASRIGARVELRQVVSRA